MNPVVQDLQLRRAVSSRISDEPQFASCFKDLHKVALLGVRDCICASVLLCQATLSNGLAGSCLERGERQASQQMRMRRWCKLFARCGGVWAKPIASAKGTTLRLEV